MYTRPTIAEFKALFYRDFPYANNDTNYSMVIDKDITKALGQAEVNFNDGLWESQAIFAQAYMYLAAHYLVEDIRASSSGLNSQYAGNTIAKAVGNVSESYTIPPKVSSNPFLAGIYTTRYGKIFVEMISPRLIGQVMTIQGGTTP